MLVVATALVSQLTVSGALARPRHPMSQAPGTDIGPPSPQAGVCLSDPGLTIVSTSGQICPTENICLSSGAFPKLIVHGIKHWAVQNINGLARSICNLAEPLLATPELYGPFSKSFIAGK